MKSAAIAALGLATLWVLLALAQLWFHIVSSSVFVKLTITIGILVTLIVVAALVHREYIREQELKDKGYLD